MESSMKINGDSMFQHLSANLKQVTASWAMNLCNLYSAPRSLELGRPDPQRNRIGDMAYVSVAIWHGSWQKTVNTYENSEHKFEKIEQNHLKRESWRKIEEILRSRKSNCERSLRSST